VEVAVSAVSALIALVSAAISLAALVLSRRVARQQTAIQEQLAAIAKARRDEEVEARSRAQVTASIDREGSRTTLLLRNQGLAAAREVSIDVASLDGHRPGPSVNGQEVLPVDLQPGQPLRFGIPVALGDPVAFRVTVSWTDGAGRHAEPFALQLY
jgi:hypothetical protein